MTVEETIITNLARRLTYAQLKEQALAVLVYGTCPQALQLTPAQEAELKVLTGKYMRQHMRLNQDLNTVFTYFREHGLKPVLLKGQGCASYYPNPLLRATGDLDIWIGQKDYPRAREVAFALCGTRNADESPKHLHLKYQETSLEIHRVAEVLIHPLHHRYYQQLSQAALSGECQHIPYAIPARDFNALQVFMHLWHHFTTSGIGLRQFVDLAMILHRDHAQFNPQELETHLNKLGRRQAWAMVGNILVDILGLPQEEFPLYSTQYQGKAQKIFQLVLEEGNFGQKNGRVGGQVTFWKRKVKNLGIWLQRLGNIHRISPKLFWEQLWLIVLHVRDAVVQLWGKIS